MTIVGALIGVAAVALYLWQDGMNRCPDGDRYVSGIRQPTPFHRRYTNWQPRTLAIVSWLGAVFLASSLGTWQAAAMFVTLPGVWFGVTRPTCVDLASMAPAWGAALLWPTYPLAAIALTLASGFVHERGPVFAAIYAWHPALLVGLLAVQWWSKPAPKPSITCKEDENIGLGFVGHGSTWGALWAHRRARDLLDWEGLVFPMRAIPLAAAWLGAGPSAWLAFGVSAASRLVGTDAGRFMLWAAPPMLVAMPEIPPWVVAAHVMTFRRAV